MKARTERAIRGRLRARDGSGRSLRVAAGLSLAELADELDVDKATLSRWERGLESPRRSAAIRYHRLIEQLEQVVAEQEP
jgi:transcriptional regulator with XRE-family HTH domain